MFSQREVRLVRRWSIATVAVGFSCEWKSIAFELIAVVPHPCRADVVLAEQGGKMKESYLLSLFQMSWIAFHLPSVPLCQMQTYLPFSEAIFPSGPLPEAS